VNVAEVQLRLGRQGPNYVFERPVIPSKSARGRLVNYSALSARLKALRSAAQCER